MKVKPLAQRANVVAMFDSLFGKLAPETIEGSLWL
jgi:hypothetical protein